MEFTILNSVLQEQLNNVLGVINKKVTIPSISNVLITVEENNNNNQLSFIGTDLDISVKCFTEVNSIKGKGSMLIDPRRLAELSKNFDNNNIVSFTKQSNEHIDIICNRSKYKFVGLDSELFPEIEKIDKEEIKTEEVKTETETETKIEEKENVKKESSSFYVIPNKLFLKLIKYVYVGIGEDESQRFALQGAKLEIDGNSIKMIATDGHRLAYTEGTLENKLPTCKILISVKTLSVLRKVLEETQEENLSFTKTEHQLSFKIGNIQIFSRLLSGQFPAYDVLMFKKVTVDTQLKRHLLASCIKRISVIADIKSKAIKFNFSDNGLELNASSSENGNGLEEITFDNSFSHSSFETGFNGNYVLDYLSIVENENINLQFEDVEKQMQITFDNLDGFISKYIVMRMRL